MDPPGHFVTIQPVLIKGRAGKVTSGSTAEKNSGINVAPVDEVLRQPKERLFTSYGERQQ
jgi:hypothetical protein